MNLSEYIQNLDEELKFLPKKERLQTVGVYQTRINNYLDEGMSEDKILKSLPDYKEIAKEAYDSKGINYLERRERVVKSKQIADSIISGILILIITTAFFTITYFSVRHIISLFPLIKAFTSLKVMDAIFMVTYSVIYIIVVMMLLCFLLDLCWLLDGFMIAKFLKPFNKDFYQFNLSSWFITSAIDKAFKKKNVMLKAVFITIGILAIIAASSYFSKSYMYYAIKNTVDEERIVYDLADVDDIVFNYQEATVNIVKSEDNSLRLSIKSIFDHNSRIDKDGKKISLSMDKKYSADFLNIIKEPTPIITIYVPSDKMLAFGFDIKKGNYVISDVNLKNLNIKGIDLDLLLENSTANNIKVETDQIDLNIKNTIVNCTTKIKALRGLMLLENNQFQNLTLDNQQAKIGLENTKISDSSLIKNDYGVIQIINPIEGKWEYNGIGGTLDVNKDNASDGPFKVKAFNITASNSSNIAINNGVIEDEMMLSLNKGNLSFTYLYADINVTEACGKLDLVNIIGSIQAKTTAGELSIYSTLSDTTKERPNKEITKYFNGITSLDIETSNTNVYIGQLDVEKGSFRINKGVAVLNELYGKNITLYLIKGKTQYANTVVSNKIHKIENLVIEKSIEAKLDTDLVFSENEIIYKDVNNG